MNIRILAIILTCLPTLVLGADIASINFDALKDDMRQYYFSKPENAEAKKEFETASADERNFQSEVQKQVLSGKKPVDLSSLMSKRGGAERFQLERKLNAELKKEIYLLLKNLGLNYELIFDSSDADSIIYSKSKIDDVTTTVKQAIIDLTNKK